MKQVLTGLSVIVASIYIMAGFFGYVTWVNNPGIADLATS
jgi:hypothetical protein